MAWGAPLLALDDEHIGQCLGTTGIYDLAVSELLFRLIHRGDLVIDAGANIGYMSVLAATAGAQVIAFEPNPASPAGPSSEPRGERRGAPDRAGRAASHGGAHPSQIRLLTTTASDVLGSDTEPGAVPVQVETLDEELRGRSVAILKVDVEGAEQAVFEGASNALKEGRLRHIIFEDHHGSDSAVITQLLGYGYAIYYDRVDADGTGAGRSAQRCRRTRVTRRRAISRRWHRTRRAPRA